ncbi:MAG: restriction endonuclease subunit S, partial [Clostridia bacterium]
SNVKDGYIDWTMVKTIMATSSEVNQYRLLPHDVLMTEGGDPDKLGRGAIIHKPLVNCIHQNHIFRVRLDTSIALPEFFAEYLQHQKAKRYFLGCAKQTTGIASINMGQLKYLPLLCPPIDLQTQFAAFVAQVDKSKFCSERGSQVLQNAVKCMWNVYMGGRVYDKL